MTTSIDSSQKDHRTLQAMTAVRKNTARYKQWQRSERTQDATSNDSGQKEHRTLQAMTAVRKNTGRYKQWQRSDRTQHATSNDSGQKEHRTLQAMTAVRKNTGRYKQWLQAMTELRQNTGRYKQWQMSESTQDATSNEYKQRQRSERTGHTTSNDSGQKDEAVQEQTDKPAALPPAPAPSGPSGTRAAPRSRSTCCRPAHTHPVNITHQAQDDVTTPSRSLWLSGVPSARSASARTPTTSQPIPLCRRLLLSLV